MSNKHKSSSSESSTASVSKPASDSSTTHTSVPLSAIGILSVVGAALASMSLYEHTAQMHNIEVAVPFCTMNETFNCSKVNGSPYSVIFGLPVAAWGLSYFLAQLTLAIAAQTGTGIARRLLVGLTSLGLLFCVYLLATSVFFIKAICPLCLGVYLVTSISFVLSIVANRPESYGSAMRDSAATLRRLLPGATPMGAMHRQGILIALFIGLIGLMTPDFLLVKLIAPAAESKQRMAAEEQALDAWRASEEVEHDLITETGPMQDYGYGELSAPVQIVEFSDFQCPFCRRLSGELEQLVADFPGKVRVVARNFPLDSNCNPQMPQVAHPLACAAARFARCAGEQGQFKRASAWLSELPDLENESTSPEAFESMLDSATGTLGLDGAALKECRTASRTDEKIASDAEKAAELGLQGTPLVLINGKKLDYPTKDVIKQIIVEILTQPTSPK